MNRLIAFVLLVQCVFTMDEADDQADYSWDEDEDTPRMWRGNVTSYKKHPYFAAVQGRGFLGFKTSNCGGFFVTRYMVITSGHCVHDWSTEDIVVKYAINHADSSSGYEHKVAAKYIHPDYIHHLQNADIALLRLREPVSSSGLLINLPEPGEDEAYIDTERRSTLVAMGSSFGNDRGNIMKEASIKLFRRAPCLESKSSAHLKRFRVCAMGDDGGYQTCPGLW